MSEASSNILQGMQPEDKIVIHLRRDHESRIDASPRNPLVMRVGVDLEQKIGPFNAASSKHPSIGGTLYPIMQIVEAWNQGLAFAGLKLDHPVAMSIHDEPKRLPTIEHMFDSNIPKHGSLPSQVNNWSTLELTLSWL